MKYFQNIRRFNGDGSLRLQFDKHQQIWNMYGDRAVAHVGTPGMF